MNWFIWRQHRNQFLIFGTILTAFAALTILSGNHFWHAYQQALAACRQNPATPSCSDISGNLLQGWNGIIMRVEFITSLVIPLILGLFMGAPLIAHEYEDSTNKLVWTQSVSRRQWLTSKLLWILLFTAVYGLAIGLAVTWWNRTINDINQSRFDTGQFDIQGIVPFAYATFFTAVGIMMSAWFRKTIAALAVTLGLFIAFQAVVGQWVRPHYMTPVTVTAPMGPNALEDKIPTNAWVVYQNVVNKNGQSFNSFNPSTMPAQCQTLLQQMKSDSGPGVAVRVKAGASGGDPIDACLNNAGFHQIATYQPGYRFWDFQRIETGLYLGMSALAIGATYWLVLKRDA